MQSVRVTKTFLTDTQSTGSRLTRLCHHEYMKETSIWGELCPLEFEGSCDGAQEEHGVLYDDNHS